MAKKKPAPKNGDVAANEADANASPAATPSPSEATLSKYQKFTRARVHRSQLKNASYNPRQITTAAARNLKAGLKSHGLVNALVWNRRTGNLIGGHQRISQLDQLEESDNYLLDVDAVDVDEKTERALNILLNNPTVQGQFDLSKLEDLMGHLHSEGYDVHKTGFSTSDMQTLFSDEFMASFLPQHAAQAVAETPVVDQLEKIRLAGKAARQEQGQVNRGVGDEDVPDEPGGAAGTSEVLAGIGSAYDGAGEAGQGAETEGQEAPPQAEMTDAEYRDELIRRRGNYIGKAQSVDDAADVTIMIVFDKPSDVGRFIEVLGLDPEKRCFDFVEVSRALGIEA